MLVIECSSTAITALKQFLEAEGLLDSEKAVTRVLVTPGGCSGFKYSLLVEDAAADDDIILEVAPRVRLAVDPFSAAYLSGVVIDYESSMMAAGFVFRNPNATGGCGCGSSFSA